MTLGGATISAGVPTAQRPDPSQVCSCCCFRCELIHAGGGAVCSCCCCRCFSAIQSARSASTGFRLRGTSHFLHLLQGPVHMCVAPPHRSKRSSARRQSCGVFDGALKQLNTSQSVPGRFIKPAEVAAMVRNPAGPQRPLADERSCCPHRGAACVICASLQIRVLRDGEDRHVMLPAQALDVPGFCCCPISCVHHAAVDRRSSVCHDDSGGGAAEVRCVPPTRTLAARLARRWHLRLSCPSIAAGSRQQRDGRPCIIHLNLISLVPNLPQSCRIPASIEPLASRWAPSPFALRTVHGPSSSTYRAVADPPSHPPPAACVHNHRRQSPRVRKDTGAGEKAPHCCCCCCCCRRRRCCCCWWRCYCCCCCWWCWWCWCCRCCRCCCCCCWWWWWWWCHCRRRRCCCWRFVGVVGVVVVVTRVLVFPTGRMHVKQFVLAVPGCSGCLAGSSPS